MSPTVERRICPMNKKVLYIICGVMALIVVGLIVAVLATGGFSNPFGG